MFLRSTLQTLKKQFVSNQFAPPPVLKHKGKNTNLQTSTFQPWWFQVNKAVPMFMRPTTFKSLLSEI